jgi:polyisoprenoid-binding protein YceI
MNNRTTRHLLTALAMVMVMPAFAADTYKIDAVHSEAGFRVRHLITKVSGRFTKFTGTIVVDTKDLAKSSVEVAIEAPSITTDNEKRDEHLRSDAFFDVAKYPTLTFKSTSVKKVAKGKLLVTGTFTMHGVSKTIDIPISNNGTTPGMTPNTIVAGFEGSLKIKRSDYGIKTFLGPVGDEVEITLSVEAGKI